MGVRKSGGYMPYGDGTPGKVAAVGAAVLTALVATSTRLPSRPLSPCTARIGVTLYSRHRHASFICRSNARNLGVCAQGREQE